MTKIATARPAEVDAPPAVGMGHNRAPIEEQVVLDLADALQAKDLGSRINDLVNSLARAPVITSPTIAGRYAELIKQMVAAGKAVEAEREALNRPLLNAQRSLKGRADAITAPLKNAELEARARLKKYDDEIAEQERKREAEARRIAEAERARLQAIADEEAEKERARLQAEEDARAAEQGKLAGLIKIEAEQIEVKVEVADTNAGPIAQGDFGAKVSRVTSWHHEILSVRQLPDSILKHARVIEALDKVIAAQVRSGTREIKGCRIFPETGISVR